MARRTQVLCIEDDPEIGHLVSLVLAEQGHSVEWVDDGDAGLQRGLDQRFDLVVLDLMLPGTDGLEICSRLRAHNPHTPVVMLTAMAAKADVIRGLELGADDYLTKPFSTAELAARVQALFRRIALDRNRDPEVDTQPLDCCGLRIHPCRREVYRSGRLLALTAKEFDLLVLFARNPGHVFGRGEILNRVWGPQFDGFDHTVNTHINRLRNKIEPEPAHPRYIRTVWGVGYRFADAMPPGA